ncbi:hypothetical protein LX88_008331, partial [Lentzea californiensis]|nr:hypothetical protein [Lentzea californiensis]
AGWKRPMMGKTGTTEEYKSAAYLGATPDYAAAVQVFNDSTSPKGICIGGGPPRLCPEGNIYGGTVPAATWFDTMTKVHADLPEKPLPQVEERYLRGDGQKFPDVVGSPAATVPPARVPPATAPPATVPPAEAAPPQATVPSSPAPAPSSPSPPR